MSFLQDKQIRRYVIFLAIFALVTLCAGGLFVIDQSDAVRSNYLAHDEAIASSLLEQGVPKDAIANALTSTETSQGGIELLTELGIESQAAANSLPYLSHFQRDTLITVLIGLAVLLTFLFAGTLVFFLRRKKLYQQAAKVIENYINGDFSFHLPQNSEGAIFYIFASVEQLATMLQAKSDTDHKAKEFLKSTISDISHQTRTPIANIKLYLELLEDEKLSQNGQEFLEKIKGQMEKIEFLMQNMIKMSRLETGILQIHKEDQNLYETIRHAVADVVPEAALKGIDLYVNCEENMMIRHDSKWTEEVIYNILDNALKYTEPGGKIHIQTERQELFFKISISDTGKGIAPERQAEIFTRFYREPEVHDKPGVGIGLYLARTIMELQKGYIEVQSEIGKGACFRLYFPVNEP